MHTKPPGEKYALRTTLRSMMAALGSRPVWVCQANGMAFEVVDSLNLTDNFSGLDVASWLLLHKESVDSAAPNPINFLPEANFAWSDDRFELFSALHFSIQQQDFYLMSLVPPDAFLQATSRQMMEEEFGIFPWDFSLDQNLFRLPPGAGKAIFQTDSPSIDYQQFYTSLAAESLQKFATAMEAAINFGQGFRIELMLEIGSAIKWISFSCQSATDTHSKRWLTGLLKDLDVEKQIQVRDEKLNLWLNAGLSSFEVKDYENQTIARWGNSTPNPNATVDQGKRTTVLFDFRNKPKYTVAAEVGQETINPKPVEEKEIVPVKSGSDVVANIESLPIEDQYTSLIQWLGQSLDVQSSALGIWDGKRFEWKAWWKSPNRYSPASHLTGGEWVPAKDWLIDLENDNPENAEPGWWPQDLLPFNIKPEYGDGWMLLAEPLGKTMTPVLAIQTDDPISLMEKTAHARRGLQMLKGKTKQSSNNDQNLLAELAYKDVLLKEVNHRAKNNLAIASSLVKMQAGATEDKHTRDLLNQTRFRLDSLASLHEILYQAGTNSGSIDMHQYITRLVNGIISGFGGENLELILNVDEFGLPIRRATTVGLLLNELISNAFKHAWKPDSPGKLQIDLFDKTDSIKLRVSDNGPGFDPKGANSDSLGQMLIQEFVTQLHGKMEIINSNGTTYLLSFSK